MSYESAHLSELESIPVGDRGLVWRPIRSRFDIRAFGVNAYTAEPGAEIVEEHTEETYGHEEMYVVVSGRATFTLDGEEVDAPAGTIVHLPDPRVRRTAVAQDPGTTVLAVGGKRGEAFEPSGWELFFRASQLQPDEAVRLLEKSADAYNTRTPGFRYNLACYRALAGDRDGALETFRRAFELDPDRVREWAKSDADLDSIRGEVDAIVA
jgi:quercetin dioxygenase-like cupin family protein